MAWMFVFKKDSRKRWKGKQSGAVDLQTGKRGSNPRRCK